MVLQRWASLCWSYSFGSLGLCYNSFNQFVSIDFFNLSRWRRKSQKTSYVSRKAATQRAHRQTAGPRVRTPALRFLTNSWHRLIEMAQQIHKTCFSWVWSHYISPQWRQFSMCDSVKAALFIPRKGSGNICCVTLRLTLIKKNNKKN